MASCYICGTSGSNYRRTVNTGYSYGTFWSKNSYGSSSRSYYGLRTVCKDCAVRIDKANVIRSIWGLSVLSLVLLYLLFKI